VFIKYVLLLTGIIARRISSSHLKEYCLLLAEQKDHPGSKECKKQLLIAKRVFEVCRKARKNLNIAWIEHQSHLIEFHIDGCKVNRTDRNEL
jgi:hypothetical protein